MCSSFVSIDRGLRASLPSELHGTFDIEGSHVLCKLASLALNPQATPIGEKFHLILAVFIWLDRAVVSQLTDSSTAQQTLLRPPRWSLLGLVMDECRCKVDIGRLIMYIIHHPGGCIVEILLLHV